MAPGVPRDGMERRQKRGHIMKTLGIQKLRFGKRKNKPKLVVFGGFYAGWGVHFLFFQPLLGKTTPVD